MTALYRAPDGVALARVVIADPPWPYDNGGPQGGVDHEYPTLSLTDLCALPVARYVTSDAVLILWATWPRITLAFEVIRAWGFEYVTGFPWIKISGLPQFDLFGGLSIKPQYGVGYWVRGCTEPILLAKRGNASPPDGGWVGLLSENLGHSRKPDTIYEYAESMPGPYLELFARRKREGWHVWGNEVESDITLEVPR